MTGKTITTTITQTVTLGSASYASPLTIASSGEIAPATTGATGIYLAAGAGFDSIVNHGIILAGTGGYNPDTMAGLAGGTAIALLSSATLNNTGSITGGGGGGSDTGGYGGIGIDVLAQSTIVNSGHISGGAGAYGHYGAGGGGIGIALAVSASLTNSGTITGGAGGYSYTNPQAAQSTGGIAVSAASEAFITNTGLIVGGLGGSGGSYQQQNGARGGDGLILRDGGTLTNGATIIGGGGGISGLGSLGGIGGIGVYVAAASVANTGSITGGAGGLVAALKYYSTGGAGGAGLAATDYAAITNSGHITGGAGGPVEAGGAGGTGVTVSGYATVTNTGHITGGAGGYGGVNLDLLAGNGGYGVEVGSGTFINHGTVVAGAGGYGNATPAAYDLPSRQNGGSGGVGILAYAGTHNGISLANYGAVTGGAGGSLTAYGTYVSYGTAGGGGGGVLIFGVSFANHGTITGGAGGVSNAAVGLTGTAGIGGLGALVSVGATLTNSGTITGGTGGTNVEVGVAGGNGVVIEGGTVSDTGIIRGGAGGVSTDDGPRGDAVYFIGSYAGTLILNPGAALGGSVASDRNAADVVELAGTSTATLSGFGTEFIGLPILSFASGAQRIAEGSIAGFSTIDGFAAHDVIVLDGYTAILNETEINGGTFVLFNSLGGTTLDIAHPGAQDFILTDGGGKTTLAPVSYTFAHTLGTGTEQFILAGGTATGSIIDAGGYEQVHSAGTAAATTIAGGTLELEVGAKLTGGISFSAVKGGKLVIDSVTMPTATISGFIAGDTIKLAGVVYNSHDTVTVKTAGIVSIVAPNTTYNLNIAGATVGETGFKFATGSILTTAATAASVMAFLSPRAAQFAPGHEPPAAEPPALPAAARFTASVIMGEHPYDAAAPRLAPPALIGGHVMTLASHAPLAIIAPPHHW